MDSAAQTSVVHHSCLREDTLVNYSETKEITGIKGEGISSLGTVQLEIKVGGGEQIAEFDVVPPEFRIRQGCDVIIGANILTQLEATISYQENTCYLLGEPFLMGRPEEWGEEITLPPLTEMKVSVCTHSDDPGLLEGIQLNEFVASAHCYVVPVQGRASVLVANVSESESTVRFPVFKVQPCEEVPSSKETVAVSSFTKEESRVDENRKREIREALRISHLNVEEAHMVVSLCEKYHDIFLLKDDPLTSTPTMQATIPLKEGTQPIYVRPYRIPEIFHDQVEEEIKKLSNMGIIQESTSNFNFPIICVLKKQLSPDQPRKLRICIDLRALNDACEDIQYPLPRVDTVLESLGNSEYISVIDLASAFLQMELKPEDREKCSFTVRSNKYEWTRCPFGYKNSPRIFARLMSIVLAGLQPSWRILNYLDDVAIPSACLKSHQTALEALFDRLRLHNLKIQPDKIEFLKKSIIFLGHKVGKDGLSIDPGKVAAIENVKAPKDVPALRRVLGTFTYHRKFVPDFSIIALPLFNLLKKQEKYEWTEKCEASFRQLKAALMSPPVLRFPDFSGNEIFIVTCDASGTGLASVLSQGEGVGKDRPISYQSRTLNGPEQNYASIHREILGLAWGVSTFRGYVYGRKFILVTDCKPLIYLNNTPLNYAANRLVKWKLLLMQYDFKIVHRPGTSKCMATSDLLSRSEDSPVIEHDITDRSADAEAEEEPQVGDLTKILREAHGGKTPSLGLQVSLVETRGQRKKKEEVQDPEFGESEEVDTEDTVDQEGEKEESQSQTKKGKEGGTNPGKEKKGSPLSEAEKLKVLRQYHDSILSGHCGIQRTLLKLKHDKWSWKHMKEDVTNYVNTCELCQKHKQHYSQLVKPPLMETPTASRPMEIVSSDIIGKLPKTLRGNQYILSVHDHFTGYNEFFPLAEISAETVARTLANEYITRYGIFEIFLTDQGSNYCSDLIQELCKLLRVKKIKTTSFHCAANGKSERSHRWLESYLRLFTDADQLMWDELLPFSRIACNASQNTVFRIYSPFYLMYGRDFEFPDTLKLKPKLSYAEDDYVADFKNRMRTAYNIAKGAITKRKLTNLKTINKNREFPAFRIGDRVLLRDFTVRRGRSRKMSPFYIGPYPITDKTSPVNYVIKKGRKLTKVHASRLKPFRER